MIPRDALSRGANDALQKPKTYVRRAYLLHAARSPDSRPQPSLSFYRSVDPGWVSPMANRYGRSNCFALRGLAPITVPDAPEPQWKEGSLQSPRQPVRGHPGQFPVISVATRGATSADETGSILIPLAPGQRHLLRNGTCGWGWVMLPAPSSSWALDQASPWPTATSESMRSTRTVR